MAIQDTMILNYQAHAERTSSLGPIGDRRAVGFYLLQRWPIEELLIVLKRQGLKLEDSQQERADSLMKLATIATYAAMTVMQLTLARAGSDQSVEVVFSEEACEVLHTI